jgi:hypothetical protein
MHIQRVSIASWSAIFSLLWFRVVAELADVGTTCEHFRNLPYHLLWKAGGYPSANGSMRKQTKRGR